MNIDSEIINGNDNDPECCANCIFFRAQGVQQIADDEQGSNAREIQTGFCYRYPPTMLSLLAPKYAKPKIVGAAPLQDGFQVQIQPSYVTTLSEQWCGEHTRLEDYEAFKATRLGLVDEPEPETPTVD